MNTFQRHFYSVCCCLLRIELHASWSLDTFLFSVSFPIFNPGIFDMFLEFFSMTSFYSIIFLLALVIEVICYGVFVLVFVVLNNIFLNSLRISPNEDLYLFYLVSWKRQYIFYNLFIFLGWNIYLNNFEDCYKCLFFLYRQLFLPLWFLFSPA